MLIPLGIWAGSGGAEATYELISTQTLASASQGVTFNSIPQTYKHLEIRFVAESNFASNTTTRPVSYMQFNATGGSSYSSHALHMAADGSAGASAPSVFTASSMGYVRLVEMGGTYLDNGVPSSAIIQILDYAATNKNKTARAIGGFINNRKNIGLYSGAFMSTSAVNSISIYCDYNWGSSFIAGSRFSLYGIRG